ncbi:MAG TPA: hypothetical protein PKA39_11720 [Ignavibacteria bacterium]|nr:hypothetical protein [Ignavibacteria bacterium]
MKNLILILFVFAAVITAAACNKETKSTVKDTKMEHLTAAAFKEKVFNYEKEIHRR